jgi:peptidyl-dipeptidase A
VAGWREGWQNDIRSEVGQSAGKRFNAMLSMGLLKPLPYALHALAGSGEMDAPAILDYFAPLQKWLDRQTKWQAVGWCF